MTVMSEGLLLNLKYIKMSREEGGFQALLTQLPETLFPPYISSPSLTYRRQLKVCLCGLLFLKTLFFS